MKNKLSLSTILLITSFILLSCSSKEEKSNVKEKVNIAKSADIQLVSVEKLQKRSFKKQFISNGKLTSKLCADLRFPRQGRLNKLYYSNGDFVKKGDVIASIDNFILSNSLNQAKNNLDKSELDFQDMIIAQGYKVEDTSRISRDVINLLKIKSGYKSALNTYNKAKYEYEQSILVSPISGVVANLNTRLHTYVDINKAFCNIVNYENMEVDFSILENEIKYIKKGSKISIVPYSNNQLKIEGKITNINPWIDANGLIKLRASVKANKGLVEGMSVQVNIFQKLDKQLVIPKTAVVLRSGKHVVFTLKNGRAYWNYVKIGLENEFYYTITSEYIKEGDLIICSGNENLAHDTKVKVINK